MNRLLDLIDRIFPPKRYHHRQNGPVTINPDVRETIHVWGSSKGDTMTTTPTPEAIEAAAKSMAEFNHWDWADLADGYQTSWLKCAENMLTAAYPLMEAQAKAEALTAFADAHRMPFTMFNHDGQRVTISDLLRTQAAEYRARAAQELVLAKAIADPEGRRLADAAAALATPGLGNWPTTKGSVTP